MQDETAAAFVRVLIQVINPVRVEQRCASLDPMNLVAFREEKLRQIGSILPGDAGDQCFLCHRCVLSCFNRNRQIGPRSRAR